MEVQWKLQVSQGSCCHADPLFLVLPGSCCEALQHARISTALAIGKSDLAIHTTCGRFQISSEPLLAKACLQSHNSLFNKKCGWKPSINDDLVHNNYIGFHEVGKQENNELKECA